MTTRTFAMIFGLVFLAIGVAGALGLAGYAPGLVSDQHDGHGLLFGMFAVNQLHNVAHIIFGLWGLAAMRSAGGSIMYARGVALIYAVLAVLGLVYPEGDALGLLPLHGNDVYLHAGLALVAAYFGWMHRSAAAV